MSQGPLLRIDVHALRQNWQRVCMACAGSSIGAVVKNDAYGLGIEHVVPVLESLGCRDYWVAHWADGVALRACLGADSPSRIMVLHGLQGVKPADFAHHNLIPILAAKHELEALHGFAQAYGQKLPVGVHLDTGLTRLGMVADGLQDLQHGRPIWQDAQPVWWVTHIGHFDNPDCAQAVKQRSLFEAWTARLPRALRTVASSCAALSDAGWHLDHVRIGSALFGTEAGAEQRLCWGAQATASLIASVLRVEEVPEGTEIGYGGIYRSSRAMRIATLGIGYGDGLPVRWDAPPSFWLGGHWVPMVGGVSMGMVCVDVSADRMQHIRPGMWAQIYGPQQPLAQLSRCAGLPANVVLCQTARLARERQVIDLPVEQVVV